MDDISLLVRLVNEATGELGFGDFVCVSVSIPLYFCVRVVVWNSRFMVYKKPQSNV